jgi:DNA-binding transcriptional regulator YdaS (Cro superfamily)
MKFDAALTFYKTQNAMAQVLGLHRQQVNFWREAGVVPAKHAIRLQAHSKGKVKIDPKCYEKPGGKKGV